jgi:hypothetical protein
MVRKRVIVLANSIKRGGRCVAGREVLNVRGRAQIGSWVRPVTAVGSGELYPVHYQLSDGGFAAVRDVVDIPLEKHCNEPGQPENWQLTDDKAWRKVEPVPPSYVARLTETPPDLWFQQHERTDRISVTEQQSRSPQHSLTLVAPQDLRFFLSNEYDESRRGEHPRTQAMFRYRGVEYAMNVTDPLLAERHEWQYPRTNERPVEKTLPCGDNCCLCISLTPPFHGYHYKVVATVFELR